MKALSHLKHPTLRRVILLTAGGLALGAVVITVFNAAPRPVDIVVNVQDSSLRDRRSSLMIWSEGESVAEVDTGRGAIGSGRLQFHFWLAPQLHRLELRLDGCVPEVRTFNPREVDLVAFVYRCRQGD